MAVFEPAVQRAIERANALAQNSATNTDSDTSGQLTIGGTLAGGAIAGGSPSGGSANYDDHSIDMALDMALDHAIDGNFDSSIEKILKARFGLDHLRPKQKEVISNILAGRHTLAFLPTGYGKSLCYQLPSQVLPGVTVVISPLIALMHDQVNGLIRRGIRNATMLNSSLDAEQVDERVSGIRRGQYKLVYVAPERLESPRFRSLLQSLDVSLLVIDEAHCISQWGHDFRPQYRNLRSYLSLMPKATILALTATATPRVQRDIPESLGLPSMTCVIGSFDRPNLRFEVEQCANNADKDRHVFAMLAESKLGIEKKPSIVYTSSRKEAEELARRIKAAKITAACYHAGLSPDIRKKVQNSFEDDTISVIVSTVAFGMGVDKPNIRRVIHYNMPGSLENYYQEAGRAGRDGNQATCTLLYQAKDIYTQKWLMDKNFPDAKEVAHLLKFLHDNSQQSLRPMDLHKRMRMEDSAINSALDLLKHLNMLDVDANGVRAREISGSRMPTIDMSWLDARKERDAHRLNQIIKYAQEVTCRRKHILGYFGQTLDNTCTGCDTCHPVEKRFVSIPTPPKTAVTDASRSTRSAQSLYSQSRPASSKKAVADTTGSSELEAAILVLTGELSGKVGRTTIASILIGSKSKKLKEKKLDKVDAFGTFAHVRMDVIMDTIDNLIAQEKLQVITGMYPKLVLA